jgi:hypothetical protein
MARVRGAAVLGVVLMLVLGGGTLGCGGSESDTSSAAQLDRAKEEGERVARERARVDELEEEVRNLKQGRREGRQGAVPPTETATPSPAESSSPALLRSFHAPSGNVSCAITSDGAFCAVDSIATTFRIEGGQPGQIEGGTTLPRGSGELAGYGSTVSAGSITCTVPEADEPRGILCSDTASGHGFEASRVAARQDAY